jgi:aquaglyceroporin related protein
MSSTSVKVSPVSPTNDTTHDVDQVAYRDLERSEVSMAAPASSRFSSYRTMIREPLAECLGVMVLVIFGTGVDCQAVLSSSTAVSPAKKGDYLSINVGWAVGIAFGIWVSAGISDGHINPAVTISMATWGKFPWRKVPAYVFAQVVGGLIGAAVVYGNYIHAIDLYEGGRQVRTLATAGLFATYPVSFLCVFPEITAHSSAARLHDGSF